MITTFPQGNFLHRRLFLKRLLQTTALGLAMTPFELNADLLFTRSKKEYLDRIRHFNQPHFLDIHLPAEKQLVFESSFKRLERVRRNVGHANFSLIDFDYAIRIGRNYSSVGAFTHEELSFLEEVFYRDAKEYGFYGDKVFSRFEDRIPRKEIIKVSHSGQYIYLGEPLELFKKVKHDIGDSLVLTSGIRSTVKQMHLFLNKVYECGGNLSMASRSLAPAGYSYHGVGDFDVGKVGFGSRNFTSDFAKTDEFKKLQDLGYISIRYDENNLYGVQFEPWHIKVV